MFARHGIRNALRTPKRSVAFLLLMTLLVTLLGTSLGLSFALQETLREREAECASLKNNVFDLSTEKTEVGNRVSGLLGRIQQWEAEQGEEFGGKSGAYGSSIQGTLFSDESEGKDN